jgi:hypothetical protein
LPLKPIGISSKTVAAASIRGLFTDTKRRTTLVNRAALCQRRGVASMPLLPRRSRPGMTRLAKLHRTANRATFRVIGYALRNSVA